LSAVPIDEPGTCVVVGGSSGLGRHLAERFAAAGHALVLVSSDKRDTLALAADLNLRFGVRVEALAVDLASADLDLGAIDAALRCLPRLTTLLLAAGMNRTEDVPGQDSASFSTLTLANYVNVCRIVDRYLPEMTAAGHGSIIGFGSVAAARGRSRNAAYAAAKRALHAYFESLRHALVGTGVVAQFYVLGYLDTNLAFGQDTPLRPASPVDLARRVHDHRLQDLGTAYHPRAWRVICALVRMTPWIVYRRLRF
jgi:short-subunit dehydrogenase